MIVDALLLVVIVGSALGLLAVIGRKLAIASSVDVRRVPERRTSDLKDQLIEERFARNLRTASLALRRVSLPIGRWLQSQVRRLTGKLKQLEEQYSLPAARPTADEAGRQKVLQLLAQARAYVEDEAHTEAEQRCIEALSHDQYNKDAYRLLGEIYVAQRDYQHAREVFEFLLQIDAQDADAHVGLGRVAVGVGELQTAESEFRKSLEIVDRASVHLSLSEVFSSLGQHEQALAACQDALTLDPNNPKILDRFLTLAVSLGKRDLARDALAKLRDVNPDNQKLEEFARQVRALT